MAVMPMGEAPAKKVAKKAPAKKTAAKKVVKELKEPQLVYPTNNRVLRFYGDVMLLIGSLVTNVGLRYGGVYEYEFEDDN
jgi:hypothetical protein